MGLLFLGNQRHDFIVVIEEVAESMINLSFAQSQSLCDFHDAFAAKVESSHVANGYTQAVHHRLPAADVFQADNMRMICRNRGRYGLTPEE